MTADGHEPDLGEAAIRGARSIGMARVVVESTLVLSSVALARLLTPVEFGHAAVALAVVALAAVVGPAGLTAGVVQREHLYPRHAAAAAFLACATGVLLLLATEILAVTAGQALFGSETARLLELAAPAWLFVALGSVPQSLLLRELRFGRVAFVEGLGSVAGATTAVTMAAFGLGPEALVVGALTTLGVVAALSALSVGFVVPGLRSGALGEVGRFAAPVAFSSLVYSVFRNVDYVILSGRMPPQDVGLYWRAYQLGVDYQSKISQVMLRVSFPVYSRTTSLDDLRARRTRIVRLHAAVIIPLLASFIALAPVVVPWLFGAAWAPAVPPAQIMAVAGMAYAVATGTGPLMIAIGKPGALVRWSLCELGAYAALIWVLSAHGLIAISIGVSAFAVASLLAIQLFLLKPYVGIPVGQLVGDVLPGLTAAVAVLATAVPLRLLLADAMPTVLVILVVAAVCAAAAAAALRLFPATWSDVWTVAGGVGRFRRSASDARA